MSEYTDDDRLRLMTPEEIAAMDADDYDADEDNAAAYAAIEDEDEQQVDDSPSDGQHDEQQVDSPRQAQQPVYRASVPADMDVQVAQNRQAMAQLRRQLHDGDIDADDYERHLSHLEDQREQLQEARTRARIATEMQEQARSTEWMNTINQFVGDIARDGQVDYRKDVQRQQELDTYVRALGANPANNDKPMRWFLETAHKMVIGASGSNPQKTSRHDDDYTPQQQASTASSHFERLDSLTGLAYERALSRLSADERDDYLRGA